MVVYVASRSQLPLILWQADAPAFNVTELTLDEQPVRDRLTPPHVVQAGSHTSCGCGFNEGRQFPEAFDDPSTERINARESSRRLARYVREHHIEQIYSCWSGDEREPKEFERVLTPEALVAEDFFFRQRELLIIDYGSA